MPEKSDKRKKQEALLKGYQQLDENSLPYVNTGGMEADEAISLLKGAGDSDLDIYNPTYDDFSQVSRYTNAELEKWGEYIPEGFQELERDDMEELVSDRQGTGAKIGSGLTRLPLTAATKLGAGIGYTAALGMELLNPDNWGNDLMAKAVNEAANNSISEGFNHLEESVKEDLAPIFNSQAYKQGNWVQQLSTPEFWSSDFVDGMAFFLSSLGQTYGLSKLAMAGKMAGAFGAATGAKNLAMAEQIFGNIGTTALLSTGEAMFEAKDVRDQLLAKGVSPEIAAKKAADAFAMNMAVLAPSNLIQVGSMKRILNPSSKMAVKNMKINKSTGDLIDNTKNLKGFDKFFAQKRGKILKEVGKNVVSEGMYEENAQLAIQNLMTKYGTGEKVGNVLDAMMDMPDEMYANFGTDEGMKSMVLGGLIGTFGGGGGAIRQSLAEEKARENFIKTINEGNKNFAGNEGSMFKHKIVKEKPVKSTIFEEGKDEAGNEAYGEVSFEDGTSSTIKTKEEYETLVKEGKDKIVYETDENDNPILDKAKVMAQLVDLQRAKDLDYLIDAAYKNEDYANARILQGEKFKNLAYKYFKAGMGEEFKSQLNRYKLLSEEEVTKLGFYNEEQRENGEKKSHQEVVQEYIRDLSRLQKKYDTIEKQVVNTGFRKKEFKGKVRSSDAINNMRKEELFGIASRQHFIDKELKLATGRRDSIVSEGEESYIGVKDKEYQQRIADLESQLLSEEFKDELYIEAATEKEKSKKLFGNTALKEQLEDLKKEYNEFKEDYSVDLLELEEAKDGSKRILDPVSKMEINRENVILAELKNVKEGLSKISERLLHPSKGYRYYIDNILAIDKSKDAGVVDIMPLMKVIEASNKRYLSYEGSKLKGAKVKQEIDKANQNDFDDAVRQRLAAGENLIEIVNDILDILPPLSENTIELLLEKLQAFIEKTTLTRDDLTRDLTELQEKELLEIRHLDDKMAAIKRGAGAEELSDEEFMMENEEFMEAYIDWGTLEGRTQDRKGIIEEIENSSEYKGHDKLIEETKDLMSKLKKAKLDTISIADKTDNQLRERIAKDIYEPFIRGIYQNFEINEAYDDLNEVGTAIKLMNRFKDIFKTREGFTSFNKTLDNHISKLNRINKEIIKRKEDKEKAQKEAWESYTISSYNRLGLSIEGDTITENPAYKDFLSLLRDNIAEFDAILEKAAESGFSPVYTEIIFQKIRDLKKGAKKKIKAELSTISDNTFNELAVVEKKGKTTILKELKLRLKGADIGIADILIYKASPGRFTTELLTYIRDARLGEVRYDFSKESSIDNYSKDSDIIKLKKNLLKEIETLADTGDAATSTRQSIYDTILVHERLLNLESAMLDIESEYAFPEQITKELASLESDLDTPAPSAQQVIALRQIASAVNLPVLDKLYSGWTYLKGFAGTGKTNVALRWSTKTLGITNPASEILAFGHTKSSSKTVTDSIKSKAGTSETSFLEENVPEEVKLIVIDEIGAFDRDRLVKIAHRVKTLNETREADNKLKVITLGDPNQKTIDGRSVAIIDEAIKLPGSENIINITPLTVRYRSNIGSVVNFQDKFLDQRNNIVSDEPIEVRANSLNPAKNDKTFQPLGVLGTKNFDKDIIPLLKARDGSGTVKAIITNSALVDEYKAKLKSAGITDVEVLSVYEAQGRTIDEVYMNISKDKKEHKDQEKIYNTDIYTASSRAVKFVFVGESIPTNSTLDIELAADEAEQLEKIKKRRKEYAEELRSDIEVLKEFYDDVEVVSMPKPAPAPSPTATPPTTAGGTTTATTEPVTDEEGEEAKVETTDDEDMGTDDMETYSPNITVLEKDPLPEEEGDSEHSLKFPTNQATLEFVHTNDIVIPGVKQGDEVWYVADKFKNEPTIRIVKKINAREYREVGVLGKEEMAGLPTTVQDKLRAAMKEISEGATHPNLKKHGLLHTVEKGAVVKPVVTAVFKHQPVPLTYIYDADNTRTLSREVLNDILGDFKKVFFNDKDKKTSSEFARIRIFTKKEADEMLVDKRFKGIRLQPGVPYLYFDNPRPNNKLKQKAKPQFIRLNPKKLNKHAHSDIVAPILNFINKGREVENYTDNKFKVGDPHFNNFLRELGKGTPGKGLANLKKEGYSEEDIKLLGDLSTTKEFVDAATELFKMAYTDNNAKPLSEIKAGDTVQHKNPSEHFKDKDGNTIFPTVTKGGVISLKAGTKVTLSNGDTVDLNNLVYANRVSNGPVQVLLNQIARSNFKAGDEFLRVYKKDRKGTDVAQAIGLLSSSSPAAGYNPNSKIIKAYLKKQAKNYNISTKEAEERFKGQLMAHNENWYLDKLERFFSFDELTGDNTASNFGLRVPITRYSKNFNLSGKDYKGKDGATKWKDSNLTDKQLEDYFETGFQEIIPNSYTLTIKDTPETGTGTTTKPPTKPSPKKPGGPFGHMKRFKNITKEQIDKIGKKMTSKEAMEFIKKRLPNASDEILNIISKQELILSSIGNREVYARWRDGVIDITKDTLTDKVLRHEIFHEVFNVYLTPQEQQGLLAIIKDVYNISDVEQAEEIVAELYQERNTFTGWLKRIFNKIARFFSETAKNKKIIDDLLTKIENGGFTTPFNFNNESPVERHKSNILEDFGTLAAYKRARDWFLLEMADKQPSKFTAIPYEKEDGTVDYRWEKDEAEIDPEDSSTWPQSKLETFLDIYQRGVDSILEVSRMRQEGEEIDEDTALMEAALKKMLQFDETKDIKRGEVYTNMIKDFYPNYSFKRGETILEKQYLSYKTAVEEADAEFTYENYMEDKENASTFEDYIQGSDQINYENKLTQLAKDFTSFITYIDSNGEYLRKLNSRHSYFLLLQNLPGIDYSQGEDSILEQWQEIMEIKAKDPKVNALYTEYRNLVKRAFATQGINDKGVRENFPEGTFSPDLRYFQQGELTLDRTKFSNSKKFLQAIYEQSTIKDYNLINGIYRKAEAGNVMSELQSSVGSLIEKNVKLGTSDYVSTGPNRGNVLQTRYVSLTSYGYRNTAKTKVRNLIVNIKDDKSLLSSLLSDIASIKDSKEVGEKAISNKKKGTEKLLRKLDIFTSNTDILQEKDINKTLDGLETLLNLLNNSNEETDLEAALKPETSNINMLIDHIVNNTDDTRASSYTAGDNTKRYLYMMSSQALDTIRYLATNTKKWMANYESPAFLSSRFLSDNIFINGDSKIYNYVHHDSLKNKYNDYVTSYKKEKKNNWITRNMMFQFANVLATSSSESQKYVQQFWTPSNKPEITAAEVSIIPESEIRNFIISAIQQEAVRTRHDNVSNYSDTYDKYGNSNKDGNWRKSYLAGLDTIINNEDIYNQKVLQEESDKVLKELDAKTDALLDYLIKNKVSVANTDINTLYQNSPHLFGENKEELEKMLLSSDINSGITEDYRDKLRPFVNLFVKNNYINSHFLNQVVAGDQAMYKGSSDIIKRMSVIFAQGQRGLVNDTIGMKEKFTVAVADDMGVELDEKTFIRFKELLGKEFDPNDGQGFITKERAADIRRGFGEGAGVSMTIKPVHAEIDENGITRMMKYSAIELTDELMEMFPALAELNTKMKNAGVDEFVFKSGFKVGAPQILSSTKTEDQYIHDINPKSIVTLSNNNYRIQQQPYHDAKNQSVSQPTQLFYFLNSSGLNFQEAMDIYNDMAEVNKLGRKAVDLDVSLTGETKPIHVRNLVNLIRQQLKSNPNQDNSRLDEFLSFTDKSGAPLVSFDVPFLINKLITQFSSMVSKNTVEVRFDGAKLVLQAAYGTKGVEATRLLKDSGLEEPKWRDEDGYAEVYLPDTYKNKIEKDDLINFDRYLGFRIPSTELHSAIPLKVKGFYPTTGTKNENIIIAPKEIVFFHGSDYDIDALYVIRRSTAIKSFEGIIDQGEYVGYDKDRNFDDSIFDKIQTEIDRIFNEVIYPRTGMSYKQKQEGRRAIKDLYALKQEAYKNRIVDKFLEVITAKKNEASMMSPISLDTFSGSSKNKYDATVFDMLSKAYGLKEEKKHAELYEARDLNDILDQADYHRDNFIGVDLTGSFANQAKAIFYAFQAARLVDNNEEGTPGLHKDNVLQINGGTYNKMSLTEKRVEEGELIDNEVVANTFVSETGIETTVKKVPTINETIDMLINAAIDNVKEQILPLINATNITKNALIGAISTGIPLKTVTKLMVQPAVFKIAEEYSFEGGFNKVMDELKTKLEEALVKKSEKEGKKLVSVNDYLGIEEGQYKEAKSINLTDNDLLNTISKFSSYVDDYNNLEVYKKDENGKVTEELDYDATVSNLTTQLRAVSLLSKANRISKSMSIASRKLKVLQQLPVNIWQIQDNLELFDDWYDNYDKKDYSKDKEGNRILNQDPSKNSFTNVDYLTIPHIKESFEILKKLKFRIGELFYTHNSELEEWSKKFSIKQSLPTLKLDLGEQGIKSKNKNSALIRQEFVKYVLNGLRFKIGDNFVNFNTSKEPIYRRGVNTSGKKAQEGRESVEVGTQAWVERFADKVMELQKKYPLNKFLVNLQVERNFGENIRTIKFTNLGTLENEDVIRITEDFMALGDNTDAKTGVFNDIQIDFLKYSVLANGLSFGSTNYSSVLPVELYLPLFKALDSKLESMFPKVRRQANMERYKDLKTKSKATTNIALERAETHFGIQLAINNIDKMDKYSGKFARLEDDKGNKTKDFGIVAGKHYDLRFNVAENVNAENNSDKKYPTYIRMFSDSLYVKVHTASTGKGKEKVVTDHYYRYVGRKPKGSHSFYTNSSQVELNGYDIGKAFDKSIPIIRIIDPYTLTVSEKKTTLNKKGKAETKWEKTTYRNDAKFKEKGYFNFPMKLKGEVLEDGSIVRFGAYDDVTLSNAVDYTVIKSSINKEGTEVTYSLRPAQKIDLSLYSKGIKQNEKLIETINQKEIEAGLQQTDEAELEIENDNDNICNP